MNKSTFKKILLGAFAITIFTGILGKTNAFPSSPEEFPDSANVIQSRETLENGVERGTFTYYNPSDASNWVSLILYSEDAFVSSTGRVLVIQR
jgi:hypothetical protein